MKTYTLTEENGLELIRWTEVDGDTVHSGFYVESTQLERQTGTTDEGEPIVETYSPFADIIESGDYTDERPTAEQKLQAQRFDLIQKAKTVRDAAIDSNIVVFDVEWQVDQVSRDRMRETINVAADTNQPIDATVPWRIADNTYRDTTANDLKMVLAARANRMAEIFVQFGAWEESNVMTDFEVNL